MIFLYPFSANFTHFNLKFRRKIFTKQILSSANIAIMVLISRNAIFYSVEMLMKKFILETKFLILVTLWTWLSLKKLS
ncbi:hypothetical protein A2740_01525 [Candidatus Nomurabacteria bacterium RIFCSPHIGHO2_01_FULL_43_16]|nr:MAG: hypothetical protein A2740_01525 [Candidatus Nomurabacteria bacterium RIFCSPHIGHO2_01_FULL_43_16]OGI97397.1 MAG: hypothetical protein A3A11_02155 [Candidatus Nomurabacteria bacterium RIFCSPLOWO2_01_FULL_43_15]